ncbi:MAG: CYTH domain-containing protein [Chitinophagales bacterium]
MSKEIERKFLVSSADWQSNIYKKYAIKQGYLHSSKDLTTRIRTKNDKAFITIKGKLEGISRAEFEYEIPFEDAISLLKLCKNSIIEKTRFEVKIASHVWEIDVFEGDNKGLIVAEIELSSEDEVFEKPKWLGEEVSYDFRYQNACLVEKPFLEW